MSFPSCFRFAFHLPINPPRGVRTTPTGLRRWPPLAADLALAIVRSGSPQRAPVYVSLGSCEAACWPARECRSRAGEWRRESSRKEKGAYTTSPTANCPSSTFSFYFGNKPSPHDSEATVSSASRGVARSAVEHGTGQIPKNRKATGSVGKLRWKCNKWRLRSLRSGQSLCDQECKRPSILPGVPGPHLSAYGAGR